MKIRKVDVNNLEILMKLSGNLDENFIQIEKEYNVILSIKKSSIFIEGNSLDTEKTEKLIYNLISIIESGDVLDEQKLDYSIELINSEDEYKVADFCNDTICITSEGHPVKPKTLGQKKYISMIEMKDLVFGIGPAGTGKTYLAVAMAIKAFKNNDVKRIVITRPAIEAGENLGYLPGNLQSKIDPYLRPVYDAMHEILGSEVFLNYRKRGLIEIAPLAYMRGRTLDNAFIILDEAQNTTLSQMKMFLTRFGYGSTVVINGDASQIDLLETKSSGLSHALNVLTEIEEIGVMEFSDKDVIRHSLVRKIIKSYNNYESINS